MLSKARHFSHIYVEDAAREHPRTESIIKRFPKSEIVRIDDYQNVFGRGRQDFWRQKDSTKLVLAVKKENFIYPGNTFLQANLSPNFAYNATVLNCPYDCHYCYLQGMYSGANVVAFVNLEDYFAAAEAAITHRPDKSEPLPLAISYDTDILALEGVLGYTREWVDWARNRPDLQMEVRTKCAPMRFLKEIEPAESVQLAWTLSPDEIHRRYESGTPGPEQRIKALCLAAERGWNIRLCLDPLLRIPGWKGMYEAFVGRLRDALPWDSIERVEIGVFRVSPGYFKRMKKRPGTDLLHYPYEHANNAVSYKEKERDELVETMRSGLPESLSDQQIFIWT